MFLTTNPIVKQSGQLGSSHCAMGSIEGIESALPLSVPEFGQKWLNTRRWFAEAKMAPKKKSDRCGE